MDSFDDHMSPGRPRDGDSYLGRASGEFRRRSPSPQDRRRRHGRSRSPARIDRYEPSDRRPRDSYGPREGRPRERRRSPFSSRDTYTPGNRNRSPPIVYPDPLSVEFELELKEYRLWWRQDREANRTTNGIKGEREALEDREKEEAELEKDYKDYLIKFTRTLVRKHRDDEWFKERYNDELRNPIRSRLLAFRKGGFEQWERDLNEGVFDEFSLEGIHKSEHDGAGGVIEKEEGETTTAGETQGGQDLVPARGADLRDETLSQPTLLIKTLAPNISRDKIEEFCKEHLGEGDGGFKWLSLADPRPKKKFHRMGWVMLHPAADAMNVVERGDGRDEEGENFEIDQDHTGNGNSVTNTAEKALEAVNEKKIHDPVHGDFTCHMGVHNPPPLAKKTLWDLYSAPKRIEADLSLAQSLIEKLDAELSEVLGYDASAATKIEERVEDLKRKGWLQPPVTGPVSIKQDNGFDEDAEDGELEEGEEKEAHQNNDVDDMELLVQKKNLDLMVEYLRRVHNFCFYCVYESDSVHGLTQKCQGHLRRPRGTLTKRAEDVADASVNGTDFPAEDEELPEDGESSPQERRNQRPVSKNEKQLQTAFKHVKRFEDRLGLILDPQSVDLRKFNCMDDEEATVDELLANHVLKRTVSTDEGKQLRFDCKLPNCSKKFAAERFWLNHTTGRGAEGQPPKNPGHQAFRANITSEMALVKRFATDPSRLLIPHPDPKKNEDNPFGPGGPSHGHGMMAYTYNPDVPGGFAVRGTGMPMMSRNGGPWGNGMVSSDGPGLHHPGAMRRGGNIRHNPRPGPYDRRRPNGNGRLSPVRMSNMYGAGRYPPSGHPAAGMVGNNPFPDAMGAGGGQQPMPPREAVQGRSIKSYEDLDAVGGSGSGELNY
ncbi:unnamed protein product [Penicillium pancosmium]